MDWGKEAREQLQWHWAGHIRLRLDGLTDEEYRWEPVPGCCNLRHRSETKTSMAAGAGELVMDWEIPEPMRAGALSDLDAAYQRWEAGVSALTEEDWARPVGPAEGPWAASPYSALVLHINREAIHHMAEVLLLRDLYRNRA